MRILLATHLPIDDPSGVGAVALGLQVAGHTVQVIDVGMVPPGEPRIATRRIVGRVGDPATELPFDAPRFATPNEAGRSFANLTDDQLALYRQTLRQVLDEEVARLDPQIIHCDRLWLFAHLALESGVPYVIAAGPEELAPENADERFHVLAVQAAENTGRVIASDTRLAQLVSDRFGDLEGRIVLLPCLAQKSEPVTVSCAQELVDIYGEVLDERLGRRWRA